MTSFAVAFLISLAVAALATPIVLRIALRLQLYDEPGDRKVHTQPTPRIGGIAIVIAFFAPVTGLLVFEAGASSALENVPQLVGLYVGGALIMAIGVFDDLRGANAIQKFAVQIGVAVLMFYFGYRIDVISVPFGDGHVVLGAFALPVTVLWFVGVINAVNLIDGLDGLASGVGLICVTVLFALSVMDGNTLGALLCACLAGALTGFLFFNFNPARIFMGDTGSLFLGFVLAAFSISTSSKGSTTVALMIPMLALGLPIIDTALAIGRRVRKQRPIFSADQDHIHHKLLRAGLSHRQAVLLLYGIAAGLAGTALLLRVTSELASGLILASVAVLLFVLFRILMAHNPNVRGVGDPFEDHMDLDRQMLHGLCAQIDDAHTPEALEALLTDLAVRTGVIALTVRHGDDTLYAYSRRFSPREVVHGLSRYAVPLSAGDTRVGDINLQFVDRGVRTDLAVVLPWELLGAPLARAASRIAWVPFQAHIAPAAADLAPFLTIPGMSFVAVASEEL